MRGNYAGAESLFREVLERYEVIFGGEHPNIATTLNNLAEVLRRQGRADESEPVQRRCLAMRRKFLGDEHASVATSIPKSRPEPPRAAANPKLPALSSFDTKMSLLPALVRLKVPAPGSKSAVPWNLPVV